MRNMYVLSGFMMAVGLAKLLTGATSDAILVLVSSFALYYMGTKLEKS